MLSKVLLVIGLVIALGATLTAVKYQGYKLGKSEAMHYERLNNDCQERELKWIELLKGAR